MNVERRARRVARARPSSTTLGDRARRADAAAPARAARRSSSSAAARRRTRAARLALMLAATSGSRAGRQDSRCAVQLHAVRAQSRLGGAALMSPQAAPAACRGCRRSRRCSSRARDRRRAPRPRSPSTSASRSSCTAAFAPSGASARGGVPAEVARVAEHAVGALRGCPAARPSSRRASSCSSAARAPRGCARRRRCGAARRASSAIAVG